MTCSYCQTPLAEVPTATLQCGHTVHTRCLLIECHAQQTFDYVPDCPSCHQTWVNDAFLFESSVREQQIEQDTERRAQTNFTAIQERLQTDQDYQTNFAKLRTILKECSAKRTQFKRTFNQAKQKFTTLTDTSLQYIRMLSKQTIQTVKDSEEYKAYVRTQQRKERLLRAILDTHDTHEWHLSNQVPLESDWRQTLRTSIRKAFQPTL